MISGRPAAGWGRDPARPAGAPAPSSADLPPHRARVNKGVVKRRFFGQMKEYTQEELVKREQRKITRELKRAKISDYNLKILEPVILNSAWMRVQLDEARKQMEGCQIVVEYDNGGGQKGLRENPIFKAYEALWKSFMVGMGRILDAIPAEKQEELTEKIEEVRPQTVLEKIREKKRAGA